MKQFIYLLAIVIVFTSCKEFQPCVFSGIESAKVVNMTNGKAEVELNVTIKNPNNFGFNIYPSDFNVKLGDTDIGNAHLKKKVHIQANSAITNTFIVQADVSKIIEGGIGSLISIFQTKKIAVAVSGQLNAGRLFYRKKLPIDLKENISLN